jgi:hypothetical protein
VTEHRSYTEADLELARKWVLPFKNKPLASEVALLIADVSRAAATEVEALRARTEKAEERARDFIATLHEARAHMITVGDNWDANTVHYLFDTLDALLSDNDLGTGAANDLRAEVKALRARTEKAEQLAKIVEKRRAHAVAWAKDLEMRLRGVIRGLQTLRQNPPFDVKTFVGHLIEAYAERMDREELLAFIGTFDVDEEIVMDNDYKRERERQEHWASPGVRPAATSWEYLAVMVEGRSVYRGSLSSSPSKLKPTHTAVAKELTRLGSLGWELVQVIDGPDEVVLYMKMPSNKPIASRE